VVDPEDGARHSSCSTLLAVISLLQHEKETEIHFLRLTIHRSPAKRIPHCVVQVAIDSSYAALVLGVCVIVGFATGLDPQVCP